MFSTQNHQPWRPPQQCNASTCPMAASTSSEAQDVLHRVMHPTLHRRIPMAIKIASDSPAFSVVVDSLFAHNVS